MTIIVLSLGCARVSQIAGASEPYAHMAHRRASVRMRITEGGRVADALGSSRVSQIAAGPAYRRSR